MVQASHCDTYSSPCDIRIETVALRSLLNGRKTLILDQYVTAEYTSKEEYEAASLSNKIQKRNKWLRKKARGEKLIPCKKPFETGLILGIPSNTAQALSGWTTPVYF